MVQVEASAPAPCTPVGTSRCLARSETDEKVVLRQPEVEGEACKTDGDKDAAGMAVRSPVRRSMSFTAAVSREFQKLSCDHLPIGELTEKLINASFTSSEIEQGFSRLDAINKILCIDDLVFRL